MTDLMGYEGQIFQGAAGAEATNLMENSRDIGVGQEPEKGDTSRRGAGTSPPINTERVTAMGVSLEWAMLNDDTDTNLIALRNAHKIGGPIAIRMKDKAAGKGFDGDVTVSISDAWPYKGEQLVTISATPTREAGRDPQIYV